MGAEITLTTPTGVRHSHVNTAVGYGGASDVRVHFGSKGRDGDSARGALPSGTVQVLENVASNQVLVVTEPAGDGEARPLAGRRAPRRARRSPRFSRDGRRGPGPRPGPAGGGRMGEAKEPVLPVPAGLPTVSPTVRFVDVAGKSAFAYTRTTTSPPQVLPQPMCGASPSSTTTDGKVDIFFTNGGKLPTTPGPTLVLQLPPPREGRRHVRGGDAKAEIAGRSSTSRSVAAGTSTTTATPTSSSPTPGRTPLPQRRRRHVHERDRGLRPRPEGEDLLSVCAAFFDYDRDGLLDLVVSHYTFWSPQTDRRCPTSTARSTATQGSTRACPLPPPQPRQREVRGRSEKSASASGRARAWDRHRDFDDNGWPDAFVANDTEPNFLYMNQGDGTFLEESWTWASPTTSRGRSSPHGADTRDFNNDGWPDVFYNNLQSQIWALFQNEGGKHFRYASPRSGVARLSAGSPAGATISSTTTTTAGKTSTPRTGRRLHRPELRQHDTMFHNVDGKVFADVSEASPRLHAEGLPARLGGGHLNGDGFPTSW